MQTRTRGATPTNTGRWHGPLTDRRTRYSVPPRRRPAGRAIVAALALAATLPAGASADVRDAAEWSATVRSGATVQLPQHVCRGFLPSDYEAWSRRTGRRVGDDRLSIDRARRAVTNGYRGPVRLYVWCG